MADQYTPEEIAEIFEAYNNAIKTGTPISAELAKQMQDASKGFKGATDELNKFAKSLGTSAAQFTKSMYNGEQGMNAMGGAVDGVGTALEFLIGLIPGARLLKTGLTLLTKATVGAVKVAGEQSDKLYKSYQDLSRAGAATAGGMIEVFENMQKFGYGLEELEQMTQLVKANSKELGLFLGTVGQGARVLADTAESIQRSGIQREFLNMGMKVDDINKGIAGYIVQQGRLGKLQGQTQAELNAGARAYVKEMEILTRLTGQTREEMEQQREQANTIDQFYAVVSELEPGKAAEVQKVFNHLMAIDPSGSKARGFAESISGFQGFSEDQNKLYMATGGALASNMEALKNGTINSAQFLDKLGVAIKDNETNLRAFAKTGSGADAFGGFYSNMKLANKATQGFEKSAADAADSLVPLDGVTDTVTGMRQDQMRARDSLQSFVKLGVKPATDALAKLAGGKAAVAGALPGDGGKAPMGGAGKTYEQRAIEKYGKPPAAPAAGAVDNELLNKLTKTGITGKREQANILAQVQAESGGVAKSENLNYSPEQLLKTFPKHVKDMQDAQQLVSQGPEAVGNRVYGGRMGNQANEGFTYRGRGLIQLTGKDNYAKYGKLLGIDLVKDPDLANDPSIAKDIAAAYFAEKQKKGVNLADITAIGKAVGYVDHGGQETKKRAQLSSQYESQLSQPHTQAERPSAPADKKTPQAQAGGVLAGPTSGYTATLHGTEAVVPLPNGKTIPVEMAGFSGNFADQTSLMSQQLDKLDELVRVMQNQVSVSTKILQAAN